MHKTQPIPESPLSLEEIELIENTGLSTSEKHYLRLIAHCLACFKSMNKNGANREVPIERIQLNWCLDQPILKNDESFISLLMEQFATVGKILEKIADEYQISPLDLTLKNLIKSIVSEKKN